MKNKISRNQLLAEIAGWYGALAILTAYSLMTFDVIDGKGMVFQLLNLTGAIGIIIIAAYKKVAQSIVLNIVWLGVAIFAIFKLIF